MVNDDTADIAITSSVSHNEGNSSTTAYVFTISLSNPADQPITVDYSTADASALSGSDYASASGTLTFTAGQTSRTITVLVNGDTTVESDETFTVGLTNALFNGSADTSRATITQGTG